MKATRDHIQALRDVRDFGDPWHRVPKYGPKRGHMSKIVGEIKKSGWVTYTRTGRYQLTDDGLALVPVVF